jgi:hypothetical protein
LTAATVLIPALLTISTKIFYPTLNTATRLFTALSRTLLAKSFVLLLTSSNTNAIFYRFQYVPSNCFDHGCVVDVTIQGEAYKKYDLRQVVTEK